MSEIKTVEDVQRLASGQGIKLNASDFASIAKARELARSEIMSRHGETVDRYAMTLKRIESIGNVILTTTQAVIVNLGVPLVLLLLLIVEQQRVQHGIQLFEANEALAAFSAFSLVALNLLLEVQVHYIEHTKGYESERSNRWSLRLWAKNAAYRLGLGDDWTAQEQSPAHRYRQLLNLVTFSILALALAGSMSSVIQTQDSTWHEALIAIATQSKLIDMFTWLGGLLFAAAAVLAAQGLSRYVAIRTVEILATMPSQDNREAEIEQAVALHALAILREKAQKKEQVVIPPNPFGSTVPAPVDHEYIPMNGNGNGHGGIARSNGNHNY